MMNMALYPCQTSILETQRLILREMSEKDYPALSRILQDEKVMYAYNGAFSDEETKTWLQNQLRRYRDYGFGLWAVVLKSSNEMIGQCGLTMQTWKEQEKLEVGYLFAHRFWHNGYATEAAKACLDYAFHTLNATEVCSIIRDMNLLSIKVALRNGMRKADTWTKHYRGIDMPHCLYVKEA